MPEIPIFTLVIATYISTNDHLERAVLLTKLRPIKDCIFY